ncbi:MAG: hypothetical protein IJC50_01485 [Clostridia bacterium]|nr:hypothetical protein [Clostridia bacterium]
MIDILYEYNEHPDEDIVKLCKQLGAEDFLGKDIAAYFSTSSDVIAKRQTVFKNLSESPSLFESIEKVYDKLKDTLYNFERARIGISNTSNEATLNTVCAMNSYVRFVNESYDELRHYDLYAEGLKDFFDLIRKERDNPDFISFCKNLEEVTVNIKSARSVTLGINLDVNLRPMEAGLVSVNTEAYSSANFIDRLLRGSLNKPRDFECICPLSSMENASTTEDLAIINSRLNNALNSVLKKDLKHLSKSSVEYVTDSAERFTPIKKGLAFYLNAIRFYNRAKSIGLPTFLPQISGRKYALDKLYNFRVAESKGVSETEPNSLQFDENGRIYVLTGANSGGKTVFLESLALAQLLFQFGLPIFCGSAAMFPFERIHVYFASEAEAEKNLYGRFENEARWFSEKIKNTSDEKELFIMDELFSGTAADEASTIALSALKMIDDKGCRAVFSTHLHDLAKNVAKNESDARFLHFDNLYINSQTSGRRYAIIRGNPEKYESKAVNIARKYGIV